MKRTLFVTTSTFALLAFGGDAQADGLYLSVFGGLNTLGATSLHLPPHASGTLSAISTDVDLDHDTGFVIGGAIGTSLDRWVQGLRSEVEVSYRRNDFNGDWHTFIEDEGNPGEGFAKGPLSGNHSTFAVMANVWYDVDIGAKVVSYVGGGAGWNRSHVDIAYAITDASGLRPDFFSAEDRSNGFAWQLGAGFNYDVAPGVKLGLGYRHFRSADFDDVFLGKNDTPVKIDNGNDTVQLNLTIDTN